MSLLARGLTSLVRGYQRWISPAIGPRCRYYPTCSHYAVEAVETHGAIKGTVLSVWRVLRCNPWSDGGVNHVPPKGSWKSPEWIPPEDWAGYDIPERSKRRFLWRKRPAASDRPGPADDQQMTSSRTDDSNHAIGVWRGQPSRMIGAIDARRQAWNSGKGRTQSLFVKELPS